MARPLEPHVYRKAVIGGSVGNFVEWYDFSIYGLLAPFIARLFFPSEDPTGSLLDTFAVFALAFFLRPIGGFVIGYLGDRIGRRNALSLAIILMALSTGFIGVLPTYERVGILAPLLLVVARVGQGFSAGGEWGGSAAFLVEHAPQSKRGFFGSWQQFSTRCGLLVGSGVAALLTSFLSDEAMSSWGW